MSMRPLARSIATAAGLVIGATGCGPSSASLLAESRPREAICRVSSVEEAQVVLPRALDGIQAEWRLQKLQREDLPALDDDAARELFDRNHVAVVEVRLLDHDKKPTRTLANDEIKAKLEGVPSIGNRAPVTVSGKLVWVWPKVDSPRVSVSAPLSFRFKRNSCVALVRMKLMSEPFDLETSDPQRFVPFSFERWNGDAEVHVRAHAFLGGIQVVELAVPSRAQTPDASAP